MNRPKRIRNGRVVQPINISFEPNIAAYIRERAAEEQRSLAWVVNRIVEREMVEAEVQRALRERMAV